MPIPDVYAEGTGRCKCGTVHVRDVLKHTMIECPNCRQVIEVMPREKLV